jgi:serine/threonine-protein kinase
MIPVLVRACVWEQPPYEGLLVLPENRTSVTSWSNPNEAWQNVVRGIQRVLKDPSARRPRPSEEGDHLFHGSGSARTEPQYKDLEGRRLAEQLDNTRARRQRLVDAGEGVEEIEREILALRRQLRERGHLRAGDTLADGRYWLLKTIGRGGFAVVWEALDRTNSG